MKKLISSSTKRDISLFKLLEVVNNKPSGVAFIIDDENKLCGVVTDGDLRRWLLQGNNLDTNLKDIELQPFTYAKEGEGLDSVLSKTNNRIRLIPIVNEKFELVDYVQLDRRINIPVASPDLNGNELKYVTDAILSTWISSSGKYITTFEEEFSKFCEAKHGVATSNGTVAIHLALVALGVGPGDEVIVPDFTFAATINTVIHAGATPVIVDVEMDSWCIDPVEIKKAITPKTKAIIPVHIYGQPCDMDSIMEIADQHNLFVIEDCAEAHGATYKGKKVGSFGHINTFSFFANKIITTGEGGICLTNDEEIAAKMRMLRDHGMNKSKRYWHDEVGYNYRMTNLQAAIGCAQMERIEDIIEKRKVLEEKYQRILSKCNLFTAQKDFTDRQKTIWLVSLLINQPELKSQIISYFKEYKIDIRPFFYPLSIMPVYSDYMFSKKEKLNSHVISEKGISLPTHLNMNLERFEEVFDGFLKSLKTTV